MTGGGTELDDLQTLTQLLTNSLDVTHEGGPGALATAAAAATIDLATMLVENPAADGAFKVPTSRRYRRYIDTPHHNPWMLVDFPSLEAQSRSSPPIRSPGPPPRTPLPLCI